mgnify:FL=1
MNIDFISTHRTYLVAYNRDGKWVYKPTNANDPKKGFYPASEQIFSNNALQVAIYLYNSVDVNNDSIGVSHSLYLSFTNKVSNNYLLKSDPNRIALNLDLGTAKSLYCFATGLNFGFKHIIARPSKTPKKVEGSSNFQEGVRQSSLTAYSSNGGEYSKIRVDLSETDLVTLAAYCLGYGRLLFPSLSDVALQTIFTQSANNWESVSSATSGEMSSKQEPHNHQQHSGSIRACAENSSQEKNKAPDLDRLKKAVWAIGNGQRRTLMH